MANTVRSQFPLLANGIEGGLFTLSPAVFLFAGAFVPGEPHSHWRFGTAVAAALLGQLTAVFLLQHPALAKWSGFLAIVAAGLTTAPKVTHDPIAALLMAILLLSFAFLLLEYRFHPDPASRTTAATRSRLRARWSALSVLLLIFISVFANASGKTVLDAVLVCTVLISHGLLCRWIWLWYRGLSRTALITLDLALLAAIGFSLVVGYSRLSALAAITPNLFLLTGQASTQEHRGQWWEPLLSHPSRVLFTTFSGLCCLGTMLLLFPRATHTMDIAPIDAAFTAVSAVCVTGLIVLDTPNAFTPLGQIFVLLLIQLGGLGIMTITA